MITNNINILINYKGFIGSKHFDEPYRSGLDKLMLSCEFKKRGYKTSFYNINEYSKYVNNIESYIIYTSSQDFNLYYKLFIEDIIYSLKLVNFKLIVDYKYLKAHHNKVFMELLKRSFSSKFNTIHSLFFGTIEELVMDIDFITFPCILKGSEGSSGKNVYIANNRKECLKIANKISKSRILKHDIRDIFRYIKHKKYTRESTNRQKFIIQNFIPNLINDWKIYIFGKRLYVFYRPIFKHRGFRASGGGYDNYFYDQNAKYPANLFNFCYELYNEMAVPCVSIDVAYDGVNFHLLEYQAIDFGTAGIIYSNGYFELHEDKWIFIADKLSIEHVYVDSIVYYIEKYMHRTEDR